MIPSDFRQVDRLIATALAEHAFPAAVAEAGRSTGASWRLAAGSPSGEEASPPATLDTVFDLASLTKVIATTTLAMRLVDAGRLGLDDRVADWSDDWRGRDREMVTVGDLLSHASGLSAYLPLYKDGEGRREFEKAICALPLEYVPRSRSVYSDLGFMLLAFIVEDAGGQRLDAAFEAVRAELDLGDLMFRPPREWASRTAPTGVDTWRRRLLVGEVHDRNAWGLGGVAGHAGLFGTAAAVGVFARSALAALRTAGDGPSVSSGRWLAQPGTVQAFARRTNVPGSSRALGWDTMLPTSSCGTRLSPTAIGHTGFTGTSLWIDWEADFYAVLLTNRVHPDEENERITEIRRAFHDSIAELMSDTRRAR